jgi:transposase-like protein
MARTGRKCTVCQHEQVIAINQALLRGESIRNVAKQYGLGESSVFRHKRDHISSVLVRAQEAVQIAQADSLLDQVKSLQTKALALLEQAEAAGDLRTALAGIREARACLELLAKLQGELAQEGTINVTLSPEWLSLRTVILQTLDPWPQARLAIAEAVAAKEVEVKGVSQ